MPNQKFSRRNFLRDSAIGVAASTAVGAALADPGLAAAQAVGVKKADLPDFTIKEVKVYVTDMTGIHKLNSSETGEIVSIVTSDGIEGNYALGNRNRTEHWLDWAKPNLTGRSVIELLPTLTATSGMKSGGGFGGPRVRPVRGIGPGGILKAPPSAPSAGSGFDIQTRGGGAWPDCYTSAADICFWDILGKAVNQPVYKLLGGGAKDRMLAYASSQHLPAIEDYVADVTKAKTLGYKGYKIHPGQGQHTKGTPIPAYIGHMEEIKEVRKAVGDEFVLMHDPVQAYNRHEAMTVGRLLDELNFAWFEDPIRTIDTEGLVELCRGARPAASCRRISILHRRFRRVHQARRNGRGPPDRRQRRRNERLDARGPAGRRLRPGVHAAQLGKYYRPRRPLPSGTGAAERLLVRNALPGRVRRPSLPQG